MNEIREAIKEEIKELKEKKEVAVVDKKNNTLNLVSNRKDKLLCGDNAKKVADVFANEEMKAEFSEKGAEIHKKNVNTAETEFKTETREQTLKQLRAELSLDHKYKMSMIEANGKHKAMLDHREKMVQKYSYLYETEDILDKDDNIIGSKLIDFSYSEIVNKVRQFTRNVSKLDTTVKKVLKWAVIIGAGVAIIAILKAFNIIN